MARMSARRATLLAGALALGIPAAAAAQAGSYGRYLDNQALTQSVRALAARHTNLAEVTSLVRTDAGRDVWLLTLGRKQGKPLDARPALLIVANLEGNHLIGSSAALFAAEQMLTRYGQDSAVTRLLNERTVYVIPRANPDGAELAFTMRGYEIPYKPLRGDATNGGLNVREMGTDLNGDGLITMMRVRSPEGDRMADTAEPRAMRRADRARAERGMYTMYVEGIDPANVDAYIPMGTDGVNLNRNFQHEYLYFQPHVGPHMISEVESKALADFVHDRHNIAAVLTYSFHDNLRTPPPAQRQPPQGVTGNPPNVPTNIVAADRPFFEYVSDRYQDVTGLDGAGADGEAGSFPQFVYYQVGLPSFTTNVWTVPGRGGSADVRWLAHFDSIGVDGYVDWTPARHPTLGDFEVGGFRPNARVNPPASGIRDAAEKQATFAVWLAQQLPQVEVVETQVEALGDNVYLVTATLANEQYLPTQLGMGQRIRFNRPITVRLMPVNGMTVLTGNIQQQVPRLEGMGGRAKFTWLVQAPAGTRVDMQVFAERAGGLQTIPVTLR
ncbi:M14 family metallopeptidase [soil metagenome]